MTRIRRRRQEFLPGVRVQGGGPARKASSIGAAIAIALSRAYELAIGEHVAVLEYEDEIGRAVRTEFGATWHEGAP